MKAIRQLGLVEVVQVVLAHDLAHELHVLQAALGIAQQRADQAVALELLVASRAAARAARKPA